MKKQVAVLSILMIVFTINLSHKAFCQKPAKLIDTKMLIQLISFKCIINYTSYALSMPTSQAMYAKDLANLFDEYLELNKKDPDYFLWKKYNADIKTLMKSMIGVKMFFNEKTSYPITFGSNPDGTTVMLTGGIVSDNVYNSLRLTLKQRAAKSIENEILPAFKNLQGAMSDPKIKYYGFISVYGCKDLSEEDRSSDGEVVTIVASALNIKKYIDATITDDQFIKLSQVYVYTGKSGLQKITVSID